MDGTEGISTPAPSHPWRRFPVSAPGTGLAVVLVVGLLARLWYWLARTPDYVPASDAVHYHEIALRIAEGRGMQHQFPQLYDHPTAFRPPLYPYLLGGLYRIFGEHVVVGRVLSLVLGLGVVALTYLLVLRVGGRLAATVAGLAVALYPPLVANDTFLLTEPLSLFVLLAMLHLLDAHRWAWAGVACGLLILSRPSAQFIVVVVAVWVLWQLGWKRALAFGGVTVLVVAPWVVRNWVELGSPVLVTSNGFNAAAVYSPQARESDGFVDAAFDHRFDQYTLDRFDEVRWSDVLQQLAIDTVRDDPGLVPKVLVRNAQQYFEIDWDRNTDPERSDGRDLVVRDRTLWTFYVVTVLGLVGLVLDVRRPMVALVLAIAVYFAATSIVFVAPPRVRAPFDLCMCIGLGLVVDRGWRRWRGERRTTVEPGGDAAGDADEALAPPG